MSIIDSSFAQELVQLVHKETGQNVHIFGDGGLIIATTQAERLGTVHAGAKEIMSGKVNHIAITEEMARTLSGTRPGFSVGINHGSERVGAIGISGDPASMRPIAMIASHVILSEHKRKLYMNSINTMASKINNSLQESSAALEEISSFSELQERDVEDLNDNVYEAKNNVMKTNQIIDLIQKISKQTNILGINASIEAARLGNDGRGFNVVAKEVRKLADDTGTSVNQIHDILKKIQDIILSISENLQEHTTRSKNQTQLVQSLAQEIENISVSLDDFTKRLI